uniref:Integrase catalytic domain-containing protein n=1 Tax=Tanacetum cinerariifolium TaxID=118510 RepID=A0A6L2KZ01_TANCI|nr:hypothetical protein [Tanacetum cinerariifolium]
MKEKGLAEDTTHQGLQADYMEWVFAQTGMAMERSLHTSDPLFDFPETRLPSHIKTYYGSEDSEDHLKIFQAAAKTERWAMPTWCHMFNSTLTGNVRVWCDDLPLESVKSYDDLKKAFLENYLQQQKYIQDPIELHNIKQRDGKSTEDFVRRYKLESRDVKGVPEEEVATSNHERKEIFPPRKQHESSQKKNSKKEVSRTNEDKGKLKAPPPMTTLVEKRNHAKFCEFHGEVGHNTDECMHLRKQIEEMLKAGKLSRMFKEIKQNNGKEQPKVKKKGETSGKDKALAILMVQPWERVARQRITQSFSSNPEIYFPPLGEDEGTEDQALYCVLRFYSLFGGLRERLKKFLSLRFGRLQGEPDLHFPVLESFHEHTNEELTGTDIKRIDADNQAIQTILLGLPKDIYAALDSCETAKEIWERVRQMMKGSDIGEQEKKAKLFNEWEKFTSTDGELIESYYHRFMQLMNDLKRNKHFSENIASNLKFLNNLQPEWKRHVTIVRQTKNLHETDFPQIYDFLKMNQEENFMQPSMTSLEDINDPTEAMNTALILFAKAFQLTAPTNNNQRTSSNPHNRQIAQLVMNMGQDRQSQNVGWNDGNQSGQYAGQVAQNQQGYNAWQNGGIQEWTGNVAAARAEGAGIRNQARCYDCRGLGYIARICTARPRKRDAAYLQTQLLIAQKEEAGIQLQVEEFDFMAAAGDLDEIEEVNTNFILMANLQQASTSGTQHDRAPVYDTDGLAEVQLNDNFYNNEIFNMFTQEEQYTDLLEPILKPQLVTQNDNHVTSVSPSMVQSGGTVETIFASNEEIRAHQETVYHNLVNHVAHVDMVNHNIRATNAELKSELARYKNQEQRVEISQEKYDKLENCYQKFVYQEHCLTRKINALHLSFAKQITTLNDEISNLNKQLSKEKSFISSLMDEKKRLKHDFKIRENMFLDKEVVLEAKEKEYVVLWNNWYTKCEECKYDKISYDKAYNDMQQKVERLQAHHLKTTYKNLFDSIKSNRAHAKPHDLIYENAQLRARGFENTSEFVKNTSGTSVTPCVDKPKLSAVTPHSEKLHASTQSHSVPQPREFNIVKHRIVIAPRMFKINPSQMPRVDLVPNKQSSASIRINPITNSQRHVIVKENVSSNTVTASSIGLVHTNRTIRPQPKGNTRNARIPSASKSSEVKNNVTVEEHRRTLLLSKNQKTMSSACNNIKLAIQNDKSESVCANCLGYKLFSVGQFCDADLEVTFRRNTYFIRDPDGVDLLKGNCFTNLYTINLHEMASASLICLMAHATPTKKKQKSLTPTQTDSEFKAAASSASYGFLRTKDETPEVIKNFLKKIFVRLQASVIVVRTDNGTEFKNQVIKEYFHSVGIRHETPAAKTPQQNGVVKRGNRMLVEAARTMLIFSHAPLFLWAEAIATAKPDISYLHVFGALCYSKNDHEDISKLGAKGDSGFFIGYSAYSVAYIVYNRRTKKIIETMNVTFDELSAMAFEQNSLRPGLQSVTSRQISSKLELTYAPSTITPQRPKAPRAIPAAPVVQNLQAPTASMSFQDSAPQQRNHTPSPTAFVADNVPNAVLDGDLFVNPFGTPSTESIVSSTQYVDPSNMHSFYQPYPHDYQWTKDHPLEQVIGEPSRPVLTRNQLKTNGDMCIYALTVSIIEPKTVKEALIDPALIESMQEELHQFIRLDVWELVPSPNGIKPITLKWLFKNKHDEEYMVIRNKNRLVDILGIRCTQRIHSVSNGRKNGISAWFIKGRHVYVDDIICGSTDPRYAILFSNLMKSRFEMSIMGEMTFFLGLQVNQSPNVDATKYHSMIGALMYLTSSRPDIVHATCDSGFDLTGFSDANYTGCKDTFKSTSGHTFLAKNS